MKYWCEFCECEYNFHERFTEKDIGNNCPCCKAGSVRFYKLPDFETPKQYKERTGNEINNDMAVYFRKINGDRFIDGGVWGVARYISTIKDKDKFVLIANSNKPPPDDFIPESCSC